jgi:ATP-dependent helicase IRC3
VTVGTQDGLGLAEATRRVTLRDYQAENLDAVEALHAEGHRRLLGVAATGLGKTIMFGSLAERMKARTLILAHRDELVNQARDKVLTCWPDATVGIVKAERDEYRSPVVCASVQTVAGVARLKKLASREFDLVIVDEAHHAVANTYRRVLEAVGCGPDEVPWFGEELGWSRPLLLGVTATPDRGDKVALRAVFDRIAFSQDMRWGIERGYLTDLRPYRVVLDFDMADLRVTAGDYNDTDAADALVKAGAPMAAVDAWKAHAEGRKALVFTPTVDSARLFARAFQQEGIAAGFVSGETPIEERRQLLDDFSTGKLMVLSNCAVLTEGYDEPSVGCVIMAKPTKSRALYTQMLGRGVRLYPGKSDCVAIDLVGITGEHDLVTVPDLFGLPLSALRDSRSVSEAFAAAAEEDARRLARAGAIRSEVVDVWAQRRARANFAWVEAMGGRCWVLNVGSGFVALEPEGGDNWRAVVKQAGSGFQRLIGGVNLGMAQGAAEDYVRRTAFGLVKKDARWRGGAPSAKQADAVRKWHGDPSGMTAGEASDFLAAKIATKELRGAGPRRV